MTDSNGWLLDTNVVSELRVSRRTSTAVARWFAQVGAAGCFVSGLTVAEIQHGIERAEQARRVELDRWLRVGVLEAFNGRVLEADHSVLVAWLRLIRSAKDQGRTLPQPDALIAATARRHGLVLATRNTRDFATMGIDLLNPWEA